MQAWCGSETSGALVAGMLTRGALVEREGLILTSRQMLHQWLVVPHGGVILAPRHAELGVRSAGYGALKERLPTMANDDL